MWRVSSRGEHRRLSCLHRLLGPSRHIITTEKQGELFLYIACSYSCKKTRVIGCSNVSCFLIHYRWCRLLLDHLLSSMLLDGPSRWEKPATLSCLQRSQLCPNTLAKFILSFRSTMNFSTSGLLITGLSVYLAELAWNLRVWRILSLLLETIFSSYFTSPVRQCRTVSDISLHKIFWNGYASSNVCATYLVGLHCRSKNYRRKCEWWSIGTWLHNSLCPNVVDLWRKLSQWCFHCNLWKPIWSTHVHWIAIFVYSCQNDFRWALSNPFSPFLHMHSNDDESDWVHNHRLSWSTMLLLNSTEFLFKLHCQNFTQKWYQFGSRQWQRQRYGTQESFTQQRRSGCDIAAYTTLREHIFWR